MTNKQRLFNDICNEAIGLLAISGWNQVQRERYEYLCKRSDELFDEIMKEKEEALA